MHNAPSKTKGTLVMDVITSIPNANANGMGFTKETLKNSYQSMKSTPLDYEHEQHIILGHVIEPELIEDGDFTILRTASITWKDRLREWGIEDLSKLQFSMECLYNQYDFWVKSKGVIEKENAPVEWIEKLENWDYNEPVLDLETGERVILLLGGKNGIVEFNGIGVTCNPADITAKTLYQAANKKTNEMEGEKMSFKIFETEADYNTAVATVKSEVEGSLNQVIASKDEEINSWKAKAEEFEGKYNEEKTRADAFDATIAEQAKAALLETRKQVLASKNYESDEDDNLFIAEASQEDFDKFVKRIEKAQASVAKQFEAKAERLGFKEAYASLNLTAEDGEGEGEGEKSDKPKLTAF